MRGIARFGGSLVAGDPLSSLDDDFQGSSLNSKWSFFKPAAIAGTVVGGGFLRFSINGGGAGANRSWWFDGNSGCQLYQWISGDFVAECYVEARNAADSGPVPTTNFEVAGIAAHDPASPPFNYVHVGPASDTTATLTNESKSTENSVSNYNYVAEATGRQWVQLTRVGQLFTTAYRTNPALPWIVRDMFNRNVLLPPMPNTLRLGPMVYSNVNASDVLGRFAYFTVRTP